MLEFIYPEENSGCGRPPYRHEDYLATVGSFEALTGLDFLTDPGDVEQQDFEDAVHRRRIG